MTDVPLREFIERVIDEHDRRYNERWQAQQRELALAQREMERRLEGLNELRGQVVEDRGRFMTRELFDAEMTAITSRVHKVEAEALTHRGSSTTMRWALPVFVAVVALIVALAGLLHTLTG